MPFHNKFTRLFSQYNLLFPFSIFIIFTLIILTILFNEIDLNSSVKKNIAQELKTKNDAIDTQVQEQIENYRRNIRFLFSTPPIKGLARASNNNGLDPLENTTFDQWKKRLEIIFAAFLQNNPDYEQLRVISSNEDGQELIRVHREQGNIHVVEKDRLQSKSNQSYYLESIQLSEGQLYMSPISLNQEYGKVEFPYRPMLRLSLPIFNDQQKRFGFIIVNVNASKLLYFLKNNVMAPHELALTDHEGYFLLHPNKDLMYGKDLGNNIRWDNYYTEKSIFDHSLALIHPEAQVNNAYYSLEKKITLAIGNQDNYLISHILVPVSYLNNLEMKQRTNLYIFLFLLTLVLITILIFFNRNIRKNHELAVTRAQSEAIINGSTDSIIGISNTGIISSWNNAATLMFKYRDIEVIDTPLDKLNLFSEFNTQDILQKFMSGHRQQNIETMSRQSDDSVKHYFSLSLSAIVDQSGSFNGIAIIARDVTNERTAEKSIIKSNLELEKKVTERTKELQKASEVKSAFISNISHEMRTPLNGIVGTLNLIKREPLTNSQLNYIEMTEVSVNALSVLINDILDLSKIEAGKLDLDLKEFNIIKQIESVCGSMAVKAQEKGVEFIIDIVNLKCKTIITDPHRFSQILTNLLNNAIKFTSTGFIKVIAFSEETENDSVIIHLKVADTGVGIALENQNKLFNAFSQEDKSVAAQYGGTGLGLSICRQLSDLLGGSISFESEKGVGSTFHFQIELNKSKVSTLNYDKRLENKTVAVITKNLELEHSIKNLVSAFSGKLFSTDSFKNIINSNDINTLDLPNIVIIEQNDILLKKIDGIWPSFIKANKTLKVVILTKRGFPQKKMLNIDAGLLSKPIIISEFLKELVDNRSTSTEQVIYSRRESDSNIRKNTDFDGAKILLVDDNSINLEVAIGILSSLTVNIETASNGEEAIEKILEATSKNDTYHCVFMDCQMPILNGYDASSAIRAGKAGRQNIHLPLIAMTANAMMGEKEKCLDAGMNDYITKPISAEKLITTAEKWLSSTFIKPVPAPNKIVPLNQNTTPEQSKLIDWDKKAVLSRLLNNETLLHKVCIMFIEGTPSKINELKNAIAAKDFNQIGRLSHSLKGTSGDIGSIKLHKHFSELEVLADSGEDAFEDIKNKFSYIETSYVDLEVILKKYLQV